jgi:UTP--glucose-1-phosphate uridylyltransferase
MIHPLDDPRLDWTFLKAHDFDAVRFRVAADRIGSGELSEATSIIPLRSIARYPASAVTDVGSSAQAFERGCEALRRGQVASVVLNGGMATRFGGVVKGIVEVYGGLTFLALKAEDIARASSTFGAPIPLVLMNSFATDEATWTHVKERGDFGLGGDSVLSFSQSVSIRLSPDGSLFIGNDGKPSYHAPGHGDFFECIVRSGVLAKLRARGVTCVLFSNVDNLGATVDPLIIGHHLLSGADMTAEVTEKRRTASGAWDKGGAPALIDGHLQLVEGFRFPKEFPQETLPDFSTNNMVFSASAIERDIHLDRHVVRKTVDDRPALQLESITCEASGLLDALRRSVLSLQLLRVPREGPTGRFFPVKEPADLDAMRALIKERLEEGWRLRER